MKLLWLIDDDDDENSLHQQDHIILLIQVHPMSPADIFSPPSLKINQSRPLNLYSSFSQSTWSQTSANVPRTWDDSTTHACVWHLALELATPRHRFQRHLPNHKSLYECLFSQFSSAITPQAHLSGGKCSFPSDRGYCLVWCSTRVWDDTIRHWRIYIVHRTRCMDI